MFIKWRETKDGLIVDDEGQVIMSAAAMHASCITIEVISNPIPYYSPCYDPWRYMPNIRRKLAVSHKTY